SWMLVNFGLFFSAARASSSDSLTRPYAVIFVSSSSSATIRFGAAGAAAAGAGAGAGAGFAAAGLAALCGSFATANVSLFGMKTKSQFAHFTFLPGATALSRTRASLQFGQV